MRWKILTAAAGAMLMLGACAQQGATSTATEADATTQSASQADTTAAAPAAAEPAPAPEPTVTVDAGASGVTCGESSWYGDELRGNPTASGEPFNPDGLTAAHRTLPLGTVILVEYDGKQVQVRINDRGPFHGDRILDLSEEAARQLGFKDLGAADVCFKVVSGA